MIQAARLYAFHQNPIHVQEQDRHVELQSIQGASPLIMSPLAII